MRYIYLAVLIAGSAALSGCFGDNDNNSSSKPVDPNNGQVQIDQANAEVAVNNTEAVINASTSPDTDEPQDVSRVILPEADLAEPVAINNANASL